MHFKDAQHCSEALRFRLSEARECLNAYPVRVGDCAVHLSCAQTYLETLCEMTGLPGVSYAIETCPKDP